MLVAHRRALRGLLRARRRQAIGAAGRGHVHVGHGRRQPDAGGDRGAPRAGAADRADRRPPARAARRRRRPDDRPAQALRRRRQVVLRGRRRRRHARRAALDPHARLPRLLDRGGRAARARPPELPAARAARARRRPLPDDGTGARRRPAVRRRSKRRGRARRRARDAPVRADRDRRRRRARPRLGPRAGALRRAAPAFRCSPTRCRARGAARPRSPTTTCCCATRQFAAAHRPAVRHPHRRPADLQAAARVARRARDAPRSRSTPRAAWHDPDAVVGMRDPAADRRCSTGSRPGARPADPDWLAALARGRRRRRRRDRRRRSATSCPSRWSPARSRLAARATRRCSSPRSMPIRDVEVFVAARDGLRRACSPTAARTGSTDGLDRVRRRRRRPTGPVVLLIGDVALAHDIGGLLAAPPARLPLTIVLLNNDGGGIFHFLPVAGETRRVRGARRDPPRPRLRARRGAVRLRPRAPARRSPSSAPRSSRSVAGGATTIIEVRTDRDENLALHRRVAEAASPASARRRRYTPSRRLSPPAPAAAPPA